MSKLTVLCLTVLVFLSIFGSYMAICSANGSQHIWGNVLPTGDSGGSHKPFSLIGDEGGPAKPFISSIGDEGGPAKPFGLRA